MVLVVEVEHFAAVQPVLVMSAPVAVVAEEEPELVGSASTTMIALARPHFEEVAVVHQSLRILHVAISLLAGQQL